MISILKTPTKQTTKYQVSRKMPQQTLHPLNPRKVHVEEVLTAIALSMCPPVGIAREL